jgi:hypothetical protein
VCVCACLPWPSKLGLIYQYGLRLRQVHALNKYLVFITGESRFLIPLFFFLKRESTKLY